MELLLSYSGGHWRIWWALRIPSIHDFVDLQSISVNQTNVGFRRPSPYSILDCDLNDTIPQYLLG